MTNLEISLSHRCAVSAMRISRNEALTQPASQVSDWDKLGLNIAFLSKAPQ